MTDIILVLNAGSSSIKFSMFAIAEGGLARVPATMTPFCRCCSPGVHRRTKDQQRR
jgi:hypothetical protein